MSDKLEDKLSSAKLLKQALVAEQNTIDQKINALAHRKQMLPALLAKAEETIDKLTKTMASREKHVGVDKALAEIKKLKNRIAKLEQAT